MEPLQSGNGGNPPEIQILRYQLWAFQAEFSKDSCLKSTMLTFFPYNMVIYPQTDEAK